MKTKRSLITTQQAAEILDVSQGRVRQLVLPGSKGQPPVLWSTHMGMKLLVVDEDEVRKHGAKMKKLREAGKVRGSVPKGYKRDRAGIYKRRK